MTLNIMHLVVTLNKNETQHYNAQHYVLLNPHCHILIGMLSVIMLIDVTINIFMVSVLKLMAFRSVLEPCSESQHRVTQPMSLIFKW
jgi:hypothetical protein